MRGGGGAEGEREGGMAVLKCKKKNHLARYSNNKEGKEGVDISPFYMQCNRQGIVYHKTDTKL